MGRRTRGLELESMSYALFFVKDHPNFPEGTLLELEVNLVSAASLDPTSGQPFNAIPEIHYETMGYRLPDRGDGVPGFIAKDNVIACPPFSENVPPGRCPVKITYQRLRNDAEPSFDDNPNNLGIFGIYVDQNLHWQEIVVPLPPKFEPIQRVTLTNTLKVYEVDSYETPSLEQLENGPAYSLHIGHVGPGCYDADIRLGRGRCIRIRFIKFFPPEFEAGYEGTKNAAAKIEAPPRHSGSLPVSLIHLHPEDDDYEFPIAMMNHALELATEWGENFRQPIYERMRLKYPELTDDQIAQLKKLADEAERHIVNLAEDELAGKIGETDIVLLAREKHPWIDERQLDRLKNIGMFWARK